MRLKKSYIFEMLFNETKKGVARKILLFPLSLVILWLKRTAINTIVPCLLQKIKLSFSEQATYWQV